MDCWDIFWDVRGIHHVLAATTDWVLRLFSFLLPTLPTPPLSLTLVLPPLLFFGGMGF